VHLLVDGFDGGVALEEPISSEALLGREFFRRFAQSRQAAPAVTYLWSDRAHELDTVLINQTNRMEAVGDDLGTGEPLPHKPPVWAGQVDTDQSDLLASLQGSKESTKILFAPAGMDIKDSVVLQVAEGGAEALSLVQGMLINAEIEGAILANTFLGFSLGKLLVDASYGRLAEPLSFAQDAGTDATLVLFVDVVAEGLRAMTVRPHPRKFGHKTAMATGTF